MGRELQDAELPQNACYELARCGEGNALFDRELRAYKRLFEEDEDIDNSYKVLLTSLLSNEEQKIAVRPTMQKVKEEADKSLLLLPTKEVNTLREIQGEKAHSSAWDYVVHADSGKVIEEIRGPHKERKSKHRLFEHEDSRANAVKTLRKRRKPHEKRNGKDLLSVRNNKASQESTELQKKREGKEHLIEHEDAHENAGQTLEIRSEPHHKRNGLLLLRDSVCEKAGKAFEDITEQHLKIKGKEHLIEDNDVPEDVVKENGHIYYEPFLKYLKEYGNKSSAVKYKKGSSNVDIKHEEDISSGKHSEIKKFPPSELRNNVVRKRSRRYDNVKSEIQRCPARELRNVVTKKKMFFHDEEEPTDEEIETKKRLPSKFRNVSMKEKLKYQDERVQTKKESARHTIMEISSDEDGEGNIVKCLACDCKNVRKNGREVIKKSPPADFRDNVAMGKLRKSEDKRMEIKKMSPSEFRNAAMRNCRKYEAGIEKRSDRKFRNVRVSNKNINESDNDDDDFYTDDDDDDDDYIDDDDDIDEEESEDSDLEIIESVSCHKGTLVPLLKFRDVEGNGRVTPNDSNVEFRRRALEVISKPYDEIEYKIVKKEFEARSYTDYHPDLGKVLKKYRYNRRKSLAILRGFYFWLQNKYREGAFEPWKDNMCLAVQP